MPNNIIMADSKSQENFSDYQYLYGDYATASNTTTVRIPDVKLTSTSDLLFFRLYLVYPNMDELKTEEYLGMMVTVGINTNNNPINISFGINALNGLVYQSGSSITFSYYNISNTKITIVDGSLSVDLQNATAREGFQYKWVALVKK